VIPKELLAENLVYGMCVPPVLKNSEETGTGDDKSKQCQAKKKPCKAAETASESDVLRI